MESDLKPGECIYLFAHRCRECETTFPVRVRGFGGDNIPFVTQCPHCQTGYLITLFGWQVERVTIHNESRFTLDDVKRLMEAIAAAWPESMRLLREQREREREE